MKKLISFSLPACIIITACSHLTPQQEKLKIEPEPESEAYYLSTPNKVMAKKSGYPLKDLHIGFGVYMRSCGTCHQHIMPDEVSNNDWHVIVPGMAWNSGISSTEEKALIKFLIAAKQYPNYPPDTLPPHQKEK